MIHIFARFKTGLYTATQSMSMIWHQRKLLVYLGIPAIINIIVRLIFHIVATPLASFKPTTMFYHNFLAIGQWAYKLGLFCIFQATATITIFFSVALIYRIALDMQNIPTHFISSLKACINKLGIIALWALPLAIVEYLINSIIDNQLLHSLPVYLKGTILICLFFWLLYTFFVLPIIALKDLSVLKTLQLSSTITRHSWVEIFGGECWFVMIILLVSIPFLATDVIFKQYAINPIAIFFGLFTIEFGLKCWLATAHLFFKTMLYQAYRKHFPDLDLIK